MKLRFLGFLFDTRLNIIFYLETKTEKNHLKPLEIKAFEVVFSLQKVIVQNR